MNSSTTPLFGGAITAELPSHLLDASKIRPVPDTQEVYISQETPALSIIVDLLECVSEGSLQKALEQHVTELARLASTVQTQTLQETTQTTSGEPLALFAGTKVIKVDTTVVAAAVLRLKPPANTDVLVTVNIPLTEHGDVETLATTALNVAQRVLSTLSVRDINLFI